MVRFHSVVSYTPLRLRLTLTARSTMCARGQSSQALGSTPARIAARPHRERISSASLFCGHNLSIAWLIERT